MRNIFFAVACILISHKIQSQSFDYIDEKVKAYPEFYSTKKLAKQINVDFTTELEKARAVYFWVGNNIGYDFSAKRITREKLQKNHSRKKSEERLRVEREKIVADYTIKNRIAVCDGYATLFKQLCDLTNVNSIVIEGYTKTEDKDIGGIGSIDHAWNAIIIDSDWYLVDPTWGAGSYDEKQRKFISGFNDAYFMTKPDLFFLNHYPNEPKWLLIDKTKEQFINLPLYSSTLYELGIEISYPDNGIFKYIADGGIAFKIKIPEDLLFYRFSYKYSDQEFLERMEFTVSDDIGRSTIPAPNPNSKYLSIYYNREIIVTYKINK